MDVVSVTGSMDLGIPLDLNVMAEKIKEFEYSPDLFAPCGYFKSSSLKGKTRIWKNGTIQVIGKSEKEAREDIEYILIKLEMHMDIKIIR